jgi:hypothetical protein
MRSLLVLGLVLCCHASGQNNVIATIAGYGAADFSGDGGLATAAALHGPTAVAVDTSSNLYAERFNHRIRKVSSTASGKSPLRSRLFAAALPTPGTCLAGVGAAAVNGITSAPPPEERT